MIKALSDACKLAKTQRVRGKQLVFLTDGIFRSTGYALTIRRLNQYENVCNCVIWMQNLLAWAPQTINLLKQIFGNLKLISRVYTLYVGDNKTNNCLDR